MENILLWVIGILIVIIIACIIRDRKKHQPQESSEIDNPTPANKNENPMPLYYTQETSQRDTDDRYERLMLYSKIAKDDADYFFSSMNKDPLFYPKTKGAISRMTEVDRNAYYAAVASIKERLAKESVTISAVYQLSKYEKYSASILVRALKKGDMETARHAAMNLFYCKVCRASILSDLSTQPDANLWLRDNGELCLNLTFFRIGRITGKRADYDIGDYWAGDYELIEKALDPDHLVKQTTNWKDIRKMVEELRMENPYGDR